MTNTSKRNINRVTTVLFVVIVLATICIPKTAFAISAEGFVSWYEITPPNNILYSNYETGIVQNPDNVEIYACCGKCYEETSGLTYYGAIFATSSTDTQNLTVKNIYGDAQFNTSTSYWSYTYNGLTIYFNTTFMDPYNQAENNYMIAEFSTVDGFHPTNSIANSFCKMIYDESKTINYSLPAGNVAYIKLANGFDGFGLTTTMPVKSDAFSSTTGWNSTQRWGFTDSIATDGTQLANFGDQISWSKNTIQTNIFGQTQEAYFYPEGPFTQSEYLVIVNPLYYAVQYTNGEGVLPSDAGVNQTVNNNTIHINCDDAISITVFQLTQNVTINNNIPTYTNDVTSGPYEGEVDPNTGDITWTDPDGGNNQPTTGGGNVPSTGETSFMSVINGIANRIVNVFQPAHDAIITLSNAVTNFAGWLYALYVWLPAPVLTLLTSAISVAIIIGVIKVFI